ncbi:TMEM175 family protein [Leifsonia shinshuensis]|uniref:Putative membrane protein n=1 Tax=Leifsonia shinshuensis TaxID=150026 RepID=A0A853CMT6_9MICO|nr:TMEM175 family protein [Leifsonia shinshuensis]NYJ22156.1 putative membrane protein [Leifsonia shinshuensis]
MAEVRTRGFDRLVNFSDAVVAIAITLLILPLVDASSEVAKEGIAHYFQHNFWQLLAFAISFVVIARLWMVHHQVFGWIEGYTSGLLWLNMLWLACIVFMPFTANVLSDSPNGRPDVHALYLGDLLLTALAMQFMELLIVRTPGLLSDEGRAQSDPLRGWTFIILLAVAMVLAIVLPDIGMFWLFILFLSRPVYLLLARMLRPRERAGV